jgi:hypothetical protein
MLKYTLIALFALTPTFGGAQAIPSYAEVPANCKSAVLWSYPAFYLKGEYLYFTAREDGLKFAYSGRDSSFNYNYCQNGSLYDMNWKFNSGFKAGAGLLFDCSGWDLSVLYTQFNTELNRCVNPHQAGTFLSPYFATLNGPLNRLQTPIALDEAKACFSLKLHIVDLDIANEFFVNDWFSVRPHFGAKGVWDKQTYNVDYFGYLFNDYTIFQKQTLWGAGPRVGLDVASHFGWCTAIFADFSFSALWSRYDNSRNDCRGFYYVEDPNNNPCQNGGCRRGCHNHCNTCQNGCGQGCNTCQNGCGNGCNNCCNNDCYNDSNTIFSTRGCTRNLLPILESSLGLRWELPICGGCYVLRGIVAWEAQVWFDHNRFITLTPDTQRGLGNLTLQGLRVGGSIDF